MLFFLITLASEPPISPNPIKPIFLNKWFIYELSCNYGSGIQLMVKYPLSIFNFILKIMQRDYKQKYYKNQSAFTLVELAIAITIVGLLISSILVGSSLIANTESKALLSEVQKLNESVTQFQSLYKGLPGDLPNATSFWPAAVINGDGNGQIATEASNEPFAAMEELLLSGLLDGAYQGFSGSFGSGFVLAGPSVTGNVAGAKSRAGAGLYVKCCSGTDYARTNGLNFNNHVALFSILPGNATKRAGVVTPIEAFFLDQKVDDGIPDTGLVGSSGPFSGANYAATGCYSGAGAASTYDMGVAANKEAKNCQMLFGYDWN
jgi:prepilin-type N-terminal cleavage/methylation domain-containing protein